MSSSSELLYVLQAGNLEVHQCLGFVRTFSWLSRLVQLNSSTAPTIIVLSAVENFTSKLEFVQNNRLYTKWCLIQDLTSAFCSRREWTAEQECGSDPEHICQFLPTWKRCSRSLREKVEPSSHLKVRSSPCSLMVPQTPLCSPVLICIVIQIFFSFVL